MAGKFDKMLAKSNERPAWLSNDFRAGDNRYITSRTGMRIRLKDYFVFTHGLDAGRVQCKQVDNA